MIPVEVVSIDDHSLYQVVDYTVEEPIKTLPALKLNSVTYLRRFQCQVVCSEEMGILMRRASHDGYVQSICDEIIITPPHWHLPLIDFLRNINFEVNPWVKVANESVLIARQLDMQNAVLNVCEKINDIAIVAKKTFTGIIEEHVSDRFFVSVRARCYSAFIPDRLQDNIFVKPRK